MISELRIGFLILAVLYGVTWYIWHRAYTRAETEPESFIGRVGRSFTVLFALSQVMANAAAVSPDDTAAYLRARVSTRGVWEQLRSTYYRQVALAAFLTAFASWYMLGLRLGLSPVLAPSYYMGLALAFASSVTVIGFIGSLCIISRFCGIIAWARWDLAGREFGRALRGKRGLAN
jgi:hypothetical protein